MKNALLPFFVILPLFFHSDLSAQDLEYEEVSNDPSKAASSFYLGFEPIFLDLNATNGFAVGLGAYVFFHIKQNLMFQARVQTPYYKGVLDGAWLAASGNRLSAPENGYFNDYEPAKLFYADANLSLKLLRIERENRPVKIWLNTGGTDMNNYIDGAFADKRYQLMARAGALMRSTVVSMEGIPGGNTNWPEYSGKPYTNMNSVCIYAGASINKMWDLVANITELDIGEKIARKHKSYYFDLMYAPVLDLRAMEKNGSTQVVEGDDLEAGYLKKNRFGLRLGVANMPEYKNNLSGWEIGVYPSWVAKNNEFSGAYWKWWWIIDLYNTDK